MFLMDTGRPVGHQSKPGESMQTQHRKAIGLTFLLQGERAIHTVLFQLIQAAAPFIWYEKQLEGC